MNDIVERLRAAYSNVDSSAHAHMGLEAADEIERLRHVEADHKRLLERLRALLAE